MPKTVNMKHSALITIFLLLGYFGISQKPQPGGSPLEIVNMRMDFYNQYNFKEFINLYSDTVKIYTYPDKLLGTGKGNLTSIFQPKFASKSIHVSIIAQMNNGRYVINQEVVTENGIDTKYISIYEVENGLITSVKFVRDY